MKRFYIISILIIVLLCLPIILWFLQPDKKLQIAIIDKTVPNETFREHLGITWFLNNQKYTDPKNNAYQASSDYFGFKPNEKQKTYSIHALPTNYDHYNVLYLADTYGVYQEDLPWIKKTREGARSEKIYGGLQQKEWAAMVNRFNQKKPSLFIAEYNTFASPTNETVRKNVTDYLGLRWSGWTGRYFDELDPKKNQEIPQWIVDQFHDSWHYHGGGFLLVNDFDHKVIVLEDHKQIKNGGIRLIFTKEGKKQFGLTDSPNYRYWFDIVTPKEDTTVLANYQWDLTDAGKHVLQKNQIPTHFAAVLANEHGASSSYYFAGDYNDVGKVPYFYQSKGLQSIYKIAQKFSDQAFYWSTYYPMMASIFDQFEKSKGQPDTTGTGSLKYTARIHQDSFEVWKENKWIPIKMKGVNIGMGKPGSFPGEAAITEDEYARWLNEIGKMNANVIRVYTLQPPGFYQALKRYNDNHKEKIYVFHGVWINETGLMNSLDAFEPKNLQAFHNEMKTIVDVVHGNKIVKAKRGYASGVYRADISRYVIGWILGIEWNPFMVKNTNAKYKSIGDYNGKYYQTKHGKPFENWLARQMDTITQYEVKNYHWIRPMSFTNWVTTDILKHPSDSTNQEDLVSVDPNVIYTKNEMNLTKEFASYHIYPYYPDFLNYDQKYQTFVNRHGQHDSYAGYLAELHKAHRLPILVAEFGVPSSRGMTHKHSFGWNQGHLSEKEQGKIISHLFEDIMNEKLLGGLIFTWQDEWFKRTWNTMDYDNPNRRPYWSNAQTSEQQFGLLSFDRNKIEVDGDGRDWKAAPLYQKKNGDLHALSVDYDERYLYIRLDGTKTTAGYPILLLDTVPNQGNYFIKGNHELRFTNGVDFLINLKKSQSRIEIDPYYDFFTYQYGYQLHLLKPQSGLSIKNSGNFSTMQYALNKAYYLPDRQITIPFSSYETGKLMEGNSNPAAKDYNSLADYHINANGMIELRIPWLLLQAKDPSQKEFIGDLYQKGIQASTFIDQIHVGALWINQQGKLTDSFPAMNKGVLSNMQGFTWKNWNTPVYKERLKQSYYIVQSLYANYK